MTVNLRRTLLVIIALMLVLTTAGAYATWSYAIPYVDGVSSTIDFTVGDFKWEGSEELPDDDTTGTDHNWLVTNLVAGVNSSGTVIGLNNPDSPINDYINDRLKGGIGRPSRDYFGSMAVTGGADMEQLFGADAKNLTFIIWAVSDTEYYIFTTDVYLGERGEPNWLQTSNKTPGQPTTPIGQYISPIYRTKLTRASENDDWTIVETLKGKALSCWYDENRRNNITQIPSFSPSSWVAE